ncbi:glycosyltransferase [Synechococcus elongatus]|uniref:Glycosyltransferase n=1 Tax=Synechococcus elongatus PCC 11802 TaxID=2283154 RepID=A0AAU6R4P4_SYNEL|nr:glycosyltransferase [Synechococcus elongatus]QFZ91315.1 glycosyltransferase [Synechococcus elongatus PCC 11802]
MQVNHLLPSVQPLRGAGLSSAVQGLQQAQQQQAIAATLLAADQFPKGRRARSLVTTIQANASTQTTVIHSHGLWLAPSRASRQLHRQGYATVVAPHGMLDPWAWQRRRRLKQLLWWLGEAETVRQATCLHALCPAEVTAIRQLQIQTPIALIPNGIDWPDRTQPLPPPPWQSDLPDNAQILLFLGRFHTKKGLLPLLQAWQAWASSAQSNPAAWLVLVGFGEETDRLTAHIHRESIPRCRIYGPVAGAEKNSCFAHAAGFILPSHSEGLPMAALEAMSWGLPCLLSQACNLPQAFETGAALVANPEVDQLQQAIAQWSQLTAAERTAMKSAAEQLIRQQFSWPAIAEQTRQLYRWLLSDGDRPAFVSDVSPLRSP